jgi:hypothetical protein
MGVTREDLIRSGRWLEESDEEWQKQLESVKRVTNAYISNDEWAIKIKKPVMILLISHPSARGYLTASIKTHKPLGYWMTVVYDNFIDPKDPGDTNYNQWMPPKDVMVDIDTFIMGHYQWWGGVSYPYMWGLRLAAGFALNFEYVYCINGDCIIEKPEGFPKLLEAIGDKDLMSSGPALPREIGTAGILLKSSALFKIAKHLVDHVVPFEEYEKSTQEFGNTEGRLAVAVRELELTQAVVEPPLNEQLHTPGYGFWYNTIGFRHIHGELNYSYRYKAIPPPSKYLDARYISGNDMQAIKGWEETQDKKFLEDWWCKT